MPLRLTYDQRVKRGKKYSFKSLKNRTGVSELQYKELLDGQGGKCFICKRTPNETRNGRRLTVDHDHKTGRIRGLLCVSCNFHIDWFDQHSGLAYEYFSRRIKQEIYVSRTKP